MNMKTKMEIRLKDIDKIKKFLAMVNTFNCDIDVSKGRYIVDGKSLLGILTLDLSFPINVEIHSDDQEEIKRFNEVMYDFV